MVLATQTDLVSDSWWIQEHTMNTNQDGEEK